MNDVLWMVVQALSAMLIGGACFGYWQRSWAAGLFMFWFMSGLYEISVTLVKILVQGKGCP